MPKGPKGQKRPGDVIGCAVHVARIATGEIQEETRPTVPARSAGGKKGGRARAEVLSAEKRRKIAQKAARVRWNKR